MKNGIEIHKLSKAAEVLFELLRSVQVLMKPGGTGLAVQEFVRKFLKKRGVEPALRGEGGFPADISVSVNNVAAHGVPNNTAFQIGDLVTVDAVITYNGWYGDMAWTYGIHPISANNHRLIAAAWQSCLKGALSLKAGNSLGLLGRRVLKTAHALGAGVINECCGHGIGQSLHEAPIIPYESDPVQEWTTQKGMVLNIEPVLTLGTPQLVPCEDGVAFSTIDHAPSAQYELSCQVDEEGVRILSLPGLELRHYTTLPPFF